MANKKKIIKSTPVGIASFPWLTKPDTKFDAGGEYKTDLVFEPDDIEELSSELEEILDAYFDEEKANAKPQVAKKMTKVDIIKTVYDDQGEETGQVMLRFKQKKTIQGKDGKQYIMKVNGFDAVGKPLPIGIAVYGGSRIKVNFEVVPYTSQKDKECGLTLRLRAYKVIELNSGSGGTASSYGFGDKEDGYVGDGEDSGYEAPKENTGGNEEEDDF